MSALTKEKVMWNYLHKIDYLNEGQNAIGATTSTTLRTVPAPGGNIAYVKKFDFPRPEVGVTTMADPIDVNLTITIYAADGTELGRRTGGGAYVDGATLGTAQNVYMKCVAAGGVGTMPNPFSVTFEVTGVQSFITTGEGVPAGKTVYFALGDGYATYYMEDDSDWTMRYGASTHASALDNKLRPYRTLAAAYASVAAANDDGIEVLDSETYDEELTIVKSGVSVYAELGQTPTWTSGIGTRVTREVSTQYNNTNAIFFNKNGNDANSGTWQEPKLTIANAIANRGANDVVYGGSNCFGDRIFDEAITINAAFTLESDYEYICEIINSSNIITITHINGNVEGIKTGAGPKGIYIGIAGYAGIIKNCTCSDSTHGIQTGSDNFTGTIENCTCSNNAYGIQVYIAGNFPGTIKNCICYNGTHGIYLYMAGTFTGTVENCICYNNSACGIYVFVSVGFTGTVENCICYNNSTYGIHVSLSGFTGTIRDCILYSNNIWDLYRIGGAAVTITESNYGTNLGFTIGAGCITTDPKFCKVTLSYKLGISADSGAYRTDTSLDDMGAHFRTIIIGADDIIINGFIIDGQSQYNNAIILVDTDNDTGLEVKWCTVDNYQGIQLDIYDNDTNTDTIIKNCIIKNGGNGIKFAYGGNTVEECLIYNNTIFGVHSDYTGQTFNHNVFYNNKYGIYLESNTSGIIIKNSIFDGNSLYGIYSEINIVITYCCITDATNNVNISDDSNISDSPLFIDAENENFRIKTVELGFPFDSPCKNRSDDDPVQNIGAYVSTITISDNYWKKYESEFNPQVTWSNNLKGYITFTNAEGSSDNYAKNSKRIFVLDFGKRSQVSSEILRQKMEYFATLIKMRKNDIDDTSDIFRFHQLPDTFLLTGSGVIDSSAKTMTHAQTIAENHFKGFHIGIKYTSGIATGNITAATKKLQVAPNPAWTDDEHIGFYVYHNGFYYYILDNDADELTLSDPDDTLENEANINWAIEKYFKVESNTEKGVFTLIDSDDELVDGTYSYYINFIEVKFYTPKFGYGQPITDYNREHSKTGFKVTVEEV